MKFRTAVTPLAIAGLGVGIVHLSANAFESPSLQSRAPQSAAQTDAGLASVDSSDISDDVAGSPTLDVTPTGSGADVIVGSLNGVTFWGSAGDIRVYSVGTTSCNLGDVPLEWYDVPGPLVTHHPVIGQTMYRLMDGKIEQIGQSWLKHGFCALQGTLCGSCTPFCGGCCDELGVGCSDPYGSGLNGNQAGLGPKFEINPVSGTMNWPYFMQGVTGPVGFKRLQVHASDLGLPGAQYFVEGQYIAQDDAAANNDNNNASYRPVNLSPSPTFAFTSFGGGTVQQQAGIQIWKDFDDAVTEVMIDVVNDGRFILAYKASDNGDGTWHYEYALYNMNSNRAGQSFSIPIPSGVVLSNIGFHDVDYHSGDGIAGVTYDGTDWDVEEGADSITWATVPPTTNPNANALRWGTTYNFRFDANQPPTDATGTLVLFRPPVGDDPLSVDFDTVGPTVGVTCDEDLSGNGTVGAEDLALLLGNWGPNPGHPADFDSDGTVGPADLAQLLGSWGPC